MEPRDWNWTLPAVLERSDTSILTGPLPSSIDLVHRQTTVLEPIRATIPACRVINIILFLVLFSTHQPTDPVPASTILLSRWKGLPGTVFNDIVSSCENL